MNVMVPDLLYRAAQAVVLALALVLAGCAAPSGGPPVVSGIDPDRYLGRWHEIASMPQWFQRACIAETTAEYGRGPGETIRVTNACRRADGSRSVAEGAARFTDAPGEGKLEVTFLKLFGDPVWLVTGAYWVVALDPDYRWSIVGHPGRDYGWILARTPTLPRATLVDLRGRLAAIGYDTCAFAVTSEAARPRLCDL